MSSLAAYRPDRNWQVHLLAELIESWAFDQWWRFEMAIREREQRVGGHMSPAQRCIGDAHPLLPLFTLRPGEAVAEIFGCWVDVHGGDHNWPGDGRRFNPGEARMTEREAEAMWRLIEPDVFIITDPDKRVELIRALMDRQRRRGKRGRRDMPLAIKTVENYLGGASAKLNRLLAAPGDGGESACA